MEEKDDHVTTHLKLSHEAPIFLPNGSGITSDSSPLHIGRQLVLIGTNVKEVSIGNKELRDMLVSSNIKKLNSLTPINTNKHLQDFCSSSLSTDRFASL